jgi:exodeoxyribonuclease VII large subunit
MTKMQYIRLSELTGKIKAVVDDAFGSLSFWIIADISNHSFRSQKNHHYFDLVEKDPHSNDLIVKISGKAWTTGAAKIAEFEKLIGQAFTNNIQVLINVYVEFHPVYGMQLVINDIDPNFTLGVLEQQRQATLERLAADNPGFIQKSGERYITRNNQLPLPKVIQKIALISARNSAGAEDFKHTLGHNTHGYLFEVDDYFTLVQGDNNADQLVTNMIAIFNSGKPYDAVVITRGGGAQTDFLIFDNYRIGQAVAKFPIPIITGIGHQKNETIADLMAHTQTKTPTKAAEFIIAHNKYFEDSLLIYQRKIVIKTQQVFSARQKQLSSINSSVVNQARDIIAKNKDSLSLLQQTTINTTKTILFRNRNKLGSISSQVISRPKIILYNRFNDLQNTLGNIKTFKSQYIKNQNNYLGHFKSVINMMSPVNILKKGFAIIKADDHIISNPDDITVGKEIEIILADTQIQTIVKNKSPYNGNDFNI